MKLAHIHLQNVKQEPVWHVQGALLAAICLQFVLTNNLTVGPKYIITGFELAVLIALTLIRSHNRPRLFNFRHSLAIGLIVFISMANLSSLVLVIHSLLGANLETGRSLILSGMSIYTTNIIIFGLWYWELDSNGEQGQSTSVAPIDFLFPQMRLPKNSPMAANWQPTFFDYLYISVTNAVAFSPNDTVPLTHRAKALMAIQSLISVVAVALVVTRAVTILA